MAGRPISTSHEGQHATLSPCVSLTTVWRLWTNSIFSTRRASEPLICLKPEAATNAINAITERAAPKLRHNTPAVSSLRPARCSPP